MAPVSNLVGVIGGVGPLATAYFLDMVVRLTQAERDQDHVDLIVFNHASIPDRTAFVVGDSEENPGPVMAQDARRLEAFGAELLVLPCNTAHTFTEEIARSVRIPLVSIVEETIDEAQRRVPGLARAGILATTGTVRSEVYHRALRARGVEPLVPDDAGQAAVMEIIYEQVKAGRPVDLEALRTVVASLVSDGAQVVLLGCTELSVVAQDEDLLADPLYVDSLDVLARATITRAGRQVRTDLSS
ncbi:MAG: amino acid racemase [Actinomycetales bacterium]|nr:amino acid racemase [Actinomycetales bacterium]